MAAAAGPDGHPGRLIVLEGIDGSGKSTVAPALAEALEADGTETVLTREPTDTFLGQAVRQALSDPEHDPVSEALLFTADHAAHVARLRELIASGCTVVSDRYSYSCLAYQGATLADRWPGQGDPMVWLGRVLAPFELVPDLVLLLDLPVETALSRVDGRSGETEKFEEGRFLQRVRENYLSLNEELGFVVVDASGTPEETLSTCQATVQRVLREGRP